MASNSPESVYDRVRIDYTSDVSRDVRDDVLGAIDKVVRLHNLYAYTHFDTAISGWSIDIAAHDRTRSVDLTDGQIVELLRVTAAERGITIGDLLREAAQAELD